ncbi:MAG TPA: CoA-acylating methylmalonate-semialdehyde dehydrogenase [Candidatus Binatia bacterium]|nr:CoA-acylating methylmalonate-semialdehyde dehydrogenase [Candidatus Binatia bacterium]
MSQPSVLANYHGQWVAPRGATLPVLDPATGHVLAAVPLSQAEDVARVVDTASAAFPAWRQTPPGDRIQYLFRLKALLEQHFEDLAATITGECGKTLGEARGELRRGIENVEVACGIPLMMQGYNSEDIATGIDEIMIRQPLGVVAAITPFNFPAMIPLWFLPYAIACGNTFILKPSERVAMTATRLVELVAATGLPAGVVNLVHGDKACVEALLDHPGVRAVSFVGSSAVARSVYARAAASGKRAQCQGGAKNPVVILPDADFDTTTGIVADSAFGCAGQRCLAASLAVTVGDARAPFTERIADAAAKRVVGPGTGEGVQMGPVITRQSKERIEALIERGVGEGARAVVDGRGALVPGHESGYFVRPTVLDRVAPASEIARTEIFGPVLSMIHVENIDAAIDLVNESSYGNMACLFTSSGAAARKFRYEVQAGNIGINLGVAAPMAFFPFSGWRDSFFGDLHGQGRDAIEFYTDKKVVVERWPVTWSRRF